MTRRDMLVRLGVIGMEVWMQGQSPERAGGAEKQVSKEQVFEIAKGPFEPTWESLRQFECPKWFRDAKLGLWAHWGPQSVPMFGDWYARHMYVEGHEQYRYHWRVYGHPSRFGYKDIIQLWKAEKFNPDELMELYARAGAKYFVALACHHDNFDLWNSRHHRWNAVNFGPHRDIIALWRDAARKRGFYFGVSEHLGASFRWWVVNKSADKEGPYAGVPYDGNDPAYEDLYHPNRDEPREGWYTDNRWWHRRWFERMKDLIDQHHPDLFYTDGTVPFGREHPEAGLHLIAHLYNTSARLHGGVNQAVYTQKDASPDIYPVGVLDIERGAQADIFPHPWQTDTSIGDWFYNVRYPYKTPEQIVTMLVDIVSKNGNLLLNVPQRPDGTIDEECLYILEEMAAWIQVNGEGVYETRPWKVAGEGPNLRLPAGPFKEARVDWTAEDFRFTAKGNILYAFQMRWAENGKAVVKSLSAGSGVKIVKVELLGHKGELAFRQTEVGLEITLPDRRPCKYAHCFRIQLAGE